MPELKKIISKVETPTPDDLLVAISHLEMSGTVMGDCPEAEICNRVARWLRGETERVRQVGLLIDVCRDMGLQHSPSIPRHPVPFCLTVKDRQMGNVS